MSHYSVAVIHTEGANIDEMLSPYWEELEVEPHLAYTRQEAIDWARKYMPDYADKSDEECYKVLAADYDNKDPETGNLYTTSNPNAKWDWYTVGGRWSNMLVTKDGREDTAKMSDVDFSPSPEAKKRAERFWEVCVEHQPAQEEEKFFSLYNEEFYLKRYGDKETYARMQAAFTTYAAVTPDGKWHEPGQMGWFGFSSETDDDARDWAENYYARFIEPYVNTGHHITIVDCHI